ncbi:MAG: hypothetical protein R3B13_05745 [Polyangiaceae bacterium]
MRAQLKEWCGLSVGPTVAGRLPVVVETHEQARLEGLVQRLTDLEGVAFVDLVQVDFDPESDQRELVR